MVIASRLTRGWVARLGYLPGPARPGHGPAGGAGKRGRAGPVYTDARQLQYPQRRFVRFVHELLGRR